MRFTKSKLMNLRTNSRMAVCIMLLAFVVVVPVASRSRQTGDSAGQRQAQARTDYDWVYKSGVYDRLSSSARAALDRMTGRKLHSLVVEGGGAALKSRQRPSLSSQTSPTLPNTAVNNQSSDFSSHVLQDETTSVRSGQNLVVGFNDTGAAGHGVGYAVSTDRGLTFTDEGHPPDSPDGDGSGDPILAVDSLTGVVYFTAIDNDLQHLQTYRSFDNGVTFTAPVNSTPGYENTNAIQDKDWMTVDNFAGQGQGNVYIVWDHFPGSDHVPTGIRFVESTDGGSTFGPSTGRAVALEQFGEQIGGPNIVVGPDHSIYVFYLNQTGIPGGPLFIRMSRSTDLGNTFGPPQTVAALNGTSANGELDPNGLFRTNSYPQAAVNPISGDLYVVFNDKGVDPDKGDIFQTQSTDAGATWSPPARVNDDSTTNEQFFPTVTVTPNGSALFIGFYDRRLDPSDVNIDTFGVTASIAGGSLQFGPNFRITQNSFPPVNFLGDYNQATSDSSSFYFPWADDRNTATSPDIYLAQFPLSLPADYVGFVDHAGCDSIYGWAADRNRLNTSISVDVYDGSKLIAVVAANRIRGDVGAYLGDNGLHGFIIPTPAAPQNGASHSIHLKFETSTTELTGSPATFACGAITTNYVGYVDVFNCTSIGGWVADRNRLNAPISVSIYDGPTLLLTQKAGQPRSDVGAFLGDNGSHGFSVPTPPGLLTGTQHNVHLKFETGAQELTGGSPASLTCP